MSGLTTVQGELKLYGNHALTTLGLSNLVTVGDDLRVSNHDTLTTLNGLESLTGINGDQIAIQLLVHRHAGNNTNANSQPNVGFDHIGIRGSECHPRGQISGLERVVQL